MSATGGKYQIGCVLLASGLSRRFSGQKLLSMYRGKTLLAWALDAVVQDRFSRTVVVASEGVLAAAEKLVCNVVYNGSPELGISHAIRLGLGAMPYIDACMFCVCDQPFLSRASLAGMAESYSGGILALGYGQKRGNPVIFPRDCFDELLRLEGDAGGKAVIERHAHMLQMYQAKSALELEDIDTPLDFLRCCPIKNLFLTGGKQIGKTTLLQKALVAIRQPVAGFRTLPSGDGFIFHSLLPAQHNDMPISRRLGDGHCEGFTHVFETLGVSCLQHALHGAESLIVMDELGYLESGAPNFRQLVMQCLESPKPVLGVLQQTPMRLLDAQCQRYARVSPTEQPLSAMADWHTEIRRREDTLVLRIDSQNSAQALGLIAEFLRRFSL